MLSLLPLYQNLSQVAFGMDFSEKWNDETLGLKNIKGKGSLTFLVSHSFVGLDKSFQNPFLFRVSNLMA